MRETAQILLDSDLLALPPAAAEPDTLTQAARGHMEILIPEVEQAAGKPAERSVPRYCALACVGEARGKLRAEPGHGPGGTLGYAQRLARVLNALCDHYEKIGGHS
ncbi:DUF6415 family natural product biosynthesis protein [Streptomyces sp. NPDC054950]|uniref:DUF6415 family natural product biosynthesis protein n=1 Tax=Streptomyces sp. NBC_00723 TaxID=2903673 RepID=UPI0006CDECA4|nr:hypothetical protein OV320_6428 [Actinobacteria bacterium OV320]